MIHVEIIGLRELNGRFASMLDRRLVEIQLEEAQATARTVQDVFRRRAPRSLGTNRGQRHFFEGLTGHAQVRPAGFMIELGTDQPRLARWLTEGTPAHLIRPREKLALFWPGAAHPVKVVHHPGTKPNPWEQEAEHEVLPLVEFMGNRIGVRVARGLATGVG